MGTFTYLPKLETREELALAGWNFEDFSAEESEVVLRIACFDLTWLASA